MRRMTQKRIVPKEDKTVWDALLDATMALLGASIITQFIQLLL